MNNRSKQLIRGGQIFLYNARMMVQVTARIINLALMMYLGLIIALMIYFLWGSWELLGYQAYAWTLAHVGLGHISIWSSSENYATANSFLADSVIQSSVQTIFTYAKVKLVESVIVGLLLFIVIVAIATKFFVRTGKKMSENTFISGSRLAESDKAFIKAVKSSSQGLSDIKLLNKYPMPKYSEQQGLLFHGSTGTGKSQAIMYLLDEIQRAGDQAIIYDKECKIKPYYYSKARGDIELNPLSKDCVNWDMWKECINPMDWSNMAMYLLPKALQGSDPFWVDSARTIFTSMGWKLRQESNRDALLLLKALLTTSLEQMHQILKGTESENLVNKEIEKTAISIKSVLATYTKSLRFLEGLGQSNQAAFSINDWVQAPQPGWMFITSKARYHKEVKPLLTTWLGLAMKSIQSLPPNSGRRIWLIIDEVSSLQMLEMLSDTLADIREFGGCVALGLQSIAQLNFIYGQHEAEAITDLLNTRIYSRSKTRRVADWVSGNLGPQTVNEVRESQSYGPNSIRDGSTVGSQRTSYPLIDAGTIMNMDNLNFYLHLAGNYPIAKAKIKYSKRHVIANAFEERTINFDALSSVDTQIAQLENDPRRATEVKRIQQFEEISHTLSENESKIDDLDSVYKKMLENDNVSLANKPITNKLNIKHDDGRHEELFIRY